MTNSTKMQPRKHKAAIGIALLLIGDALAVAGFFVHIALTVTGAVFVTAGIIQIIGIRTVTCPYCGKEGKMSSVAEAYKCRHCKKRCIKDGDTLKTIDR